MTYIKAERDKDQKQVDAVQRNVLSQAVVDKAGANEIDEVEVEAGVDNGEDDLLATVPDLVDEDVSVVDLQTGRDPNAKDADVDSQDDGEDGPLHLSCETLVDHEETDSVDDDLKNAVHFERPPERC